MKIQLPLFDSDNKELNLAWRVAVGDVVGNIKPYKAGLLKVPAPCLAAGLDYTAPWTRDTAINTCFCMAWLCPEVAKNSLLSLLVMHDGKAVVSGFGQDWDAAIWILGAYEYLKVNADGEFLSLTRKVCDNTLSYYESKTFNKTFGLFEGPAVYGDGVAAYPDKFLTGTSFIGDNKKPMYALSTNAMFYMAYRAAGKLCESEAFFKKAAALKNAIERHFWNETNGRYDYLAHECDSQEGLGIAFALLSGLADEHAEQLIKNVKLTPHGIACVYPTFDRYAKLGGLGRHSGTVWGFIQGFYGLALQKYGKTDEFDKNLFQMAEKACRDGQFSEIWSGKTGKIYGGLQEDAPSGKIRLWKSMRRQSWTAAGFLALIVHGVFGCKWSKGKLIVAPRLPCGVRRIKIEGLGSSEKTIELNDNNYKI